MPQIHSVQLSDDLSKRLNFLAKSTERTKSYFIREALEKSLEDIEDAYLAEKEYEKFLISGQKSIPIEEVERRLGLEN